MPVCARARERQAQIGAATPYRGSEEANGMEKTKIRVEVDDSDGLTMVRPHRQFHGKSKTALPAELEFGEDESLFAFRPGDGEELKGRYARVEAGGLVLTSDPDLYGSEDDRRAAGLMPLKRLAWGEWNMVGDFPS
jgi:hypothetical protein